jgi:hypothetical protein
MQDCEISKRDRAGLRGARVALARCLDEGKHTRHGRAACGLMGPQ